MRDTIEPTSSLPCSIRVMNRGKSRRTCAEPYAQPLTVFPSSTDIAGMATSELSLGRPTKIAVPPGRALVDGLTDGGGGADHLERVVGAASTAELAHGCDRIAVGRVDRVGRAEPQRRVALHGHRIDGDDPRRAGDARTLDDGLTDATAPDDGDDRPRLDPGGVQRGADPGGDAAADQGELVVGEIGVDLHHRVLRDRHHLGERAEAGESLELGAVRAPRARGTNMTGYVSADRLDWSCRQYQHTPHVGMNEPMTRSPTWTRVTSVPTDSTMPVPSWPRISGRAGIVPLITERSEWHTPLAVMRTITSPGPGSIGVTSSIERGWSRSMKTAARMEDLP